MLRISFRIGLYNIYPSWAGAAVLRNFVKLCFFCYVHVYGALVQTLVVKLITMACSRSEKSFERLAVCSKLPIIGAAQANHPTKCCIQASRDTVGRCAGALYRWKLACRSSVVDSFCPQHFQPHSFAVLNFETKRSVDLSS